MAIEIRMSKDGQKSYRAVLYRNHRKIAAKSFSRKYDAIKWLEQKEEQRKLIGIKNVTFAEGVSIWLTNHAEPRIAPSTIRTYRCRLQSKVFPFFGTIPLENITPERVDEFVRYVKADEHIKSNKTVNEYRKFLGHIFSYLVKRRYMTVNPVLFTDKLKEDEPVFDFMSFEEKEKFLDHAESKYQGTNRWVYRLYLIALHVGLRWGEIAALQWDRVNLLTRTITASRTYCSKKKGIRETTKGGKTRHVGINSVLHPELMQHHQERNPECNLVFQNKAGGILDLENFKRDYYAKDLRECGLRKLRFHDLRHTFASHVAMRGGDIYKLQALLGHSDVKTTQRYAHLSPNSIANETELLAPKETMATVHPLCTPFAPHEKKKALNS